MMVIDDGEIFMDALLLITVDVTCCCLDSIKRRIGEKNADTVC